MSNFLIAFGIMLSNEGGYSFHAQDAGGETLYGISRTIHPSWSGWFFIDLEKGKGAGWKKRIESNRYVKRIVKKFYKETFWDPMKLSKLKNPRICAHVFTLAVNAGIARATNTLQKAVNTVNWQETLKVDGKIGAITIKEVNKVTRKYWMAIESAFKAERVRFYLAIVRRNPSQKVFLKGWLAGVEKVTINLDKRGILV